MSSSTIKRARRTRRARGFTLVELMISLVMGLIIALAAVGLAKTSTTTFYEQARISGVEANVRAASERLRNDLSRASYMSTPNIQWDTKLAKIPGAVGDPYRIVNLQNLQGLRIAPATTIRAHAFSTKNVMTPQEVFISGNLTSDDVYRGQLETADGAGCGGAKVRITADADPAVRRLFNGETTATGRVKMAQIAFMPGEVVPASATPPAADYAVQVMDMRGCFHYMEICGIEDASTAQPNTVRLLLKGGILTTADTLGDVCGARVLEEVAIAPIQRVRWNLAVESDARRIDTTLDGTGAPNKFNLYRQLLASDGATTVGPPELIAEYAVDLKLGLIVDSSTAGTPPVFTNVDFEADDALFGQWAGLASASTKAVGPHHIRSVRYRLAFRAPFPDRRADLPMPSGPPYISRYCMGTDDPCVDYARVRTVISEVALLNQAKAY
jgi:prepilin-type N-terminal cleavage/methylation domain-containing protein